MRGVLYAPSLSAIPSHETILIPRYKAPGRYNYLPRFARVSLERLAPVSWGAKNISIAELNDPVISSFFLSFFFFLPSVYPAFIWLANLLIWNSTCTHKTGPGASRYCHYSVENSMVSLIRSNPPSSAFRGTEQRIAINNIAAYLLPLLSLNERERERWRRKYSFDVIRGTKKRRFAVDETKAYSSKCNYIHNTASWVLDRNSIVSNVNAKSWFNEAAGNKTERMSPETFVEKN